METLKKNFQKFVEIFLKYLEIVTDKFREWYYTIKFAIQDFFEDYLEIFSRNFKKLVKIFKKDKSKIIIPLVIGLIGGGFGCLLSVLLGTLYSIFLIIVAMWTIADIFVKDKPIPLKILACVLMGLILILIFAEAFLR